LGISEKELVSLKEAYPFDSQSIIDKQIEIEGLKDGLMRLEELQIELF
jgi:hypothetical protein